MAEPNVQRYSLMVAAAIMAAGLIVSLRELPSDLGLRHPGLLILSAVGGVPLAILLTIVETRLSAQAAGVRFGWSACTRLSILASAANMLPLPGGPFLRVAALRQAGARLSAGTGVTVLIGVGWLGIAFLYAAAGAIASAPVVWMGFGGVGLALTIAAGAGLYRLSRSWTLLWAVMLTKAAIVTVDLYRMKWALGSLDVAVTTREAAVFAVSGVAGAAASFVPAGLGITELAAATLAHINDVPSSAAFLAVALNRAAAIAIMVPLALAVARTPVTDKSTL